MTNKPPTKLLWVDLEMTGLDPKKDRILEVAAVVTDWDFNVISEYESGVGHDQAEVKKLLDASEFYDRYPANKKDLIKLSSESIDANDVEDVMIEFVLKHFGDEKVVLAGNSIHVDRQFIRAWWPKLDSHLHYRMLDVSAFKIVMAGKYKLHYHKKDAHRALGDIHESIAELKYYLKNFKK